jgi:hypothetical protein
MELQAHTEPMFTLAFIASRYAMRRHLTGALAGDPVLPEPAPRRRSAEQRVRQPVDSRRPAQRRAHVPRVAPQAARCDEDLL